MRLTSFPLLGDLFDRRGNLPSDVSREKLRGAMLAVMAGLSPFIDFFARVLNLPRGGVLVLVALPVVLLSACVYTIVARIPRQRQVAVLVPPDLGGAAVFDYRFGRGSRMLAKLLLLPALMVTGYTLWGFLPNRLAGRATLAGYVRVETEGPTWAYVEALDVIGEPVSVAPSPIGPSGFFWMDLRPWAFRPIQLQLTGGACKEVRMEVRAAVYLSARGADSLGPLPQGLWPEWRVACQRQLSEDS